MITMNKPINIREAARKIEVDNSIDLRNYYRIADNLLKQANNHRQDKNMIIDLYIVLLRYASLLSETIPYHQDYSTFSREKRSHRKNLPKVLDELECLRPDVVKIINELSKVHESKEQNQLNVQRKPRDASQPSSSSNQPISRLSSSWPGKKQERNQNLVLNIRANVIPQAAPSAPPIENMIIDDAPVPSDFVESSLDSSSATEDSSRRPNEGSSNAASSCIICFEAPIEGACVPCGHMAGCVSCLNEIQAKSWGCPVCRTEIELVLRLYAV